jgi:hypothetical protein
MAYLVADCGGEAAGMPLLDPWDRARLAANGGPKHMVNDL